MNPSLTIGLVFGASVALVVGHAVRVAWFAYKSSRGLNGGVSEPSTRGSGGNGTRTEIKPIPGSAAGATPPGNSGASRVIAEPKPSSSIKTS